MYTNFIENIKHTHSNITKNNIETKHKQKKTRSNISGSETSSWNSIPLCRLVPTRFYLVCSKNVQADRTELEFHPTPIQGVALHPWAPVEGQYVRPSTNHRTSRAPRCSIVKMHRPRALRPPRLRPHGPPTPTHPQIAARPPIPLLGATNLYVRQRQPLKKLRFSGFARFPTRVVCLDIFIWTCM